eukprot:Tamp_10379.p1 GENE.Tamp_10379~~Tamp_10379.p1  ORF type:complete len:361 (+),score=21.11 Tamp_10379:363-1445(+)
MAPQRPGTNLRIAFLPTTKDKAVREAFDADAGYGLNFTVASNWKKAARETIFGKSSAAEQRPPSGGRDEAFGGRDLADFEDENDAIWRNPIGAVPLVLRGKTAGDRRQMTFAADGNRMTKSYEEMDARAFFSAIRAQTSPAHGGGGAPSSHAYEFPRDTLDSRPQGYHTLRTIDPLSEVSPFRRGTLRSRPSSAVSRISYVSRKSHEGQSAGASGSQTERRRPISPRRRNPLSADSALDIPSRPASRSTRPSSGASRPGTGVRGATGDARSTHGDAEALQEAGRELGMPSASIEEDPAAWYAFAQRCFVDGRGDLARRALRALEGDETLPPADADGSMKMRQEFRPSSPSARKRGAVRPK